MAEIFGDFDEDDGEEAADNSIPEEARSTTRIACRPRKPTLAEWEAHQATHWPFRAWCPHCVAARAVASPHKSKSRDDREFQRDRILTISIDHCFVGEAARDNREVGFAWLVVFDANTEAHFAIPTGTKAVKPWIVSYLKHQDQHQVR